MDPHNFNPFDPGWRDMYHAMLERQQAGQEDFEQNLDQARRADSAPIAAAPPPLDRYPHLSRQDRSLIEAAIKAEAERGNLKEKTCLGYAIALRKLGNDLGSRDQTIDALDHNSLVAHAEKVFPRVTAMRPALAAVRRYREPDASVDERRYELSADDKNLIDAAVRAGAERHGWKSTSAQNYAGVLQRLANSLGPGQTIAALDHSSLLAHANKSFPNNRPMKAALTALREYRELGEATRGAGGSGQAEGQTIPSPVQVFDPEELWRAADQAGPLPADSWGAANFWQSDPSMPHLPAPSVNQPSSASWEHSLEESILGSPYQPADAAPAPPNLSLYLTGPWQHGDQWAPPDLIEGMRLHNVLPNPSQPQTNLTIHGVNYTAMQGPPGLEHVIFLRRT